MLLHKKLLLYSFFYILMITFCMVSISEATVYGGVNFPSGNFFFAESVVSYTPGSGATSAYDNPTTALGAPDISVVELGTGGTIILSLGSGFLTTSGDSTEDLWIFEFGGFAWGHDESTDVFISNNQMDWVNIGQTTGGTYGFDIDSNPGVISGQNYSFVKLIDSNDGITPDGADIDAIGAFHSKVDLQPAVAPEPISSALFIAGGIVLGLRRFFFSK